MPARTAQLREAEVVPNPTPADIHSVRIAEERERVPVPLDEPIYYYNPIVPDEKYRIPGTSYFRRFAAGGAVATTDVEAETIENVLAGYGRHRAERWKGNDRQTPWECKRCGFVSRNEAAIDDHRETGR